MSSTRGRRGLAADQRPVAELLWRSALAARATNRAAPAPDAVSQDIGDIAVIQDTGDLVLPPNAYDVRSTGLRFTRNGARLHVRRSTAPSAPRSAAASRSATTTAPADDPVLVPVLRPAQTAAFVNSDGNITFGEEDKSSTDRNVARLLTGPPRVAPFLADLDPTTGGGRIFVNAAADRVHRHLVQRPRLRLDARPMTVQATLLPDGSDRDEVRPDINLADSVVGRLAGPHAATSAPST